MCFAFNIMHDWSGDAKTYQRANNVGVKTRRGSPVDRRPSTAETPPIGKIRHVSKMAVTFEPLMGF